MKKILFTGLLTLIGFSASAQLTEAAPCPSDNHYTEISFFPTVLNVTKTYYDNLQMNIWYPAKTIDDIEKRPLILLMHGGGYIEGDRTDYDTIAKLFAQRGFVAATIDYRLGWDCLNGSQSHREAVYKALQDAYRALEYLHTKKSNYGINFNAVFVGGGSAGANMSLNLVFMEQSEADILVPGASATYGPLKSATYPNISIRGVFSNSGGVDPTILDVNEAVPVIAYHGTADDVIPINVGLAGPDCDEVTFWGSGKIHQVLQTLPNPVCSMLTIKKGGGHGVYQSGPEKVIRVQQAVCFFRGIMCSQCAPFANNMYEALFVPVCSQPVNTELSTENSVTMEVVNVHNQSVSVSVTTDKPATYSLVLLNSMGGIVEQTQKNLDSETTLVRFDFSNRPLASGIYLLQWQSGEVSGQEKIYIP